MCQAGWFPQVEVEMTQTWALSSGTSLAGQGTRRGSGNEAVAEAPCQVQSALGIWVQVHQGSLVGKGAFSPYQAR